MKSAAGFTLIELMVVLLIIGLSIGMVDFNVGGSEERKAHQQIEQLYQLLRFADENAALQGDLIGVQFESAINGDLNLTWHRFRAGAWLPAEAPFEALTLPDYLTLELRIDAQPVDLTKDIKTPQVVFSGSGEITEFELRFDLADAPIGMITVDFTGDLVQADTYEP